MAERFDGLLVGFEDSMTLEELASLLLAVQQLRGVLTVSPFHRGASRSVTELRARRKRNDAEQLADIVVSQW